MFQILHHNFQACMSVYRQLFSVQRATRRTQCVKVSTVYRTSYKKLLHSTANSCR